MESESPSLPASAPQPQPQPQPQPRSIPVWLRGVFIASLVLNMVTLGVVAGGIFHYVNDTHEHRWHKSRTENASNGRALRQIGLAPLVPMLNPHSRHALLQKLNTNTHVLQSDKADGAALYALMHDFADVLRTDPFDTEAAAVLFTKQRAILDRAMQRGHRILLEYLQQENVHRRSRFADRIDQQLSHERHERHERHGHPPH